MPTTRAAKRRRRGDDLLSLYQGDLGDKILSYASGQDLCTLDLLSKQFQALTTKQWKKVTKERFGMDNGKDGWRLGTSFLREPVVIKLNDDREEELGLYVGTPIVAANESIIAITSDLTGDGGISIRDASTVNCIQTDYSEISGHIRNWNITICGSVGSEIIVTSINDQICAQRGNEYECVDYTTRALNGIQLIGSESHLIIPFDGKIEIYEVNGVGESTLLSLQRSVSVEEGAVDGIGFINELIAWGPDKSCFVVGYPHQICVWNFDAVKNTISLANTITVNDWEVSTGNVALAEDYIIAATKYKQIHIWDRITGAKVFDALCDTDVDDIGMLIEDDFIYPLRMSIHGHILVTTSHIGNGLCVWDMKTGQLLHEYRWDEDEPTAMVYLKHINGFLLPCLKLTSGGCMKIWSFPTNQNQSERAVSISRQEGA